MGGMSGYEKGRSFKVDTRKMTLDDFWDYVDYLLREQRLIKKLRRERKKARN